MQTQITKRQDTDHKQKPCWSWIDGSNDNKNDDDNVIRYDFVDKWEKITNPMRTKRWNCATVAIPNYIIVFGGNAPQGTNAVESYYLSNARSKKNRSRKSKKLYRMPMSLCSCEAVNLDNNYIYVFGGNSNINIQNVVYRYSVKDNKWKTMPYMNSKRTRLAGVTIGSKVYAIGGTSEYFGYSGTLDSVEVYDTDDQAKGWIYLSVKMKTKRSSCCAVALNGTIYVIGGTDESGNILDTIEMYDTSSLSSEWIQIPATMNTKRTKASAIAIGHFILILGGFEQNVSGAGLNTIEIFNTKSNQFVETTGLPLMTRKRGGCAAALLCNTDNGSTNNKNDVTDIKGKIVVVGGADAIGQSTAEMIHFQTTEIPISELNLPSDVNKVIISFL